MLSHYKPGSLSDAFDHREFFLAKSALLSQQRPPHFKRGCNHAVVKHGSERWIECVEMPSWSRADCQDMQKVSHSFPCGSLTMAEREGLAKETSRGLHSLLPEHLLHAV
jgi:hypothetical protein